MNRSLQALAVWIGLAMTITALGLDLTNSLFWCLLILIWVAEILARAEGREQGILHSAQAVVVLTERVKELEQRLLEQQNEQQQQL